MYPGMYPGSWQPGHYYPDAWMGGPGNYMHSPIPPIPQGYGATPQVVPEWATTNETPLRPEAREGAQGARRNISLSMGGNIFEWTEEDKVEIIELLKESKEQLAAMLTDKARVDQELRELQAQFYKMQCSLESKLQQQIHQAREMIEQLETDRQIAIAEMKQQVHEENERKDGEILRLRSQAHSLGQENFQLKERIEKLEIASTDQLEKARANQLAKARAIFKRLKAEKSEAIAKGESRLKEYGNKMKVEKENLQLAKARAIFKRLKAEKSEAIAKGESRLKEYGNKMKVEENLQKQGNDFQNMERAVNQLQMKLAQSEEIYLAEGDV
ncbi:golgin subfamily A member 4-like [Dreissena polymorpha]|nr:golgin subfamily A member 4-like [Dreissena polymorpha]